MEVWDTHLLQLWSLWSHTHIHTPPITTPLVYLIVWDLLAHTHSESLLRHGRRTHFGKSHTDVQSACYDTRHNTNIPIQSFPNKKQPWSLWCACKVDMWNQRPCNHCRGWRVVSVSRWCLGGYCWFKQTRRFICERSIFERESRWHMRGEKEVLSIFQGRKFADNQFTGLNLCSVKLWSLCVSLCTSEWGKKKGYRSSGRDSLLFLISAEKSFWQSRHEASIYILTHQRRHFIQIF